MNKNLWTKLFIALFVFYVIFSVSKVIYQGYKVNTEIAELKVQITELDEINKTLGEQILYYKSPSYREKIARERLGLQKPGEEVIVILPEEKPKVVDTKMDNTANYLKWWKYFFKKS